MLKFETVFETKFIECFRIKDRSHCKKYYLGRQILSQTVKEYSLLLQLQSYQMVEPEEVSAIMWAKPILLQEKHLNQEEL